MLTAVTNNGCNQEPLSLANLYRAIEVHVALSRRKDFQTSIRILARVLSFSEPSHCPQEAYHIALPKLLCQVEQYLTARGKSRYSIRNTKNNLRFLFRVACEKGILCPVQDNDPPVRFNPRKRPNRRGSEASKPTGYYFLSRHWPEDLKREWEKLYQWATAPVVSGRPAEWRKRPATMKAYICCLESFFGYLHNVRKFSMVTFDQVFRDQLIEDYMHWHINELHKRVTKKIIEFLYFVKGLTRQYRDTPELTRKLTELIRSLPEPAPVYDKNEAWVPLAKIDEVAKELWPTGIFKLNRTGIMMCVYAGLSLMLRLWCRRPYRQRNMREMKLGENLYKDSSGRWTIAFYGEQLKIAEKNGQRNKFVLPFPEELVPLLEEYLSKWRPHLSNLTGCTYQNLFLNKRGTPHDYVQLGTLVKNHIYKFTGKPCHPHLIRTIWATEYVRSTGNFYRAAIMLNDKVETVIKRYSQLLEQGVAEETDHWLKAEFSK